ncbi:MAG: ATP-binding cassette domain-containing protein [Candidatus Omnitrophica bacterium]|nr:ATP-binding cassette domain-containing protein [Candidatus Omnitrophota bacterium]MBU4477917.1 ATP-binding cassette domain-containing protein [Candidatus Omnitrophota bacterium]
MAILRLRNITKFYEINRNSFSLRPQRIKAVDNVCLTLTEGMTLGLVGESGCGKSTLAKIILKLIPPTSGEIIFKEKNITRLSESAFRPLRRQMQIVFQDPYGSLSPRLTVKDIIAEPLRSFGMPKIFMRPRIEELLIQVGLNSGHADRLPQQLSGGERQRVGIARALATSPRLVVLDEAVSSLDLSTQAQVLNLLVKLQQKYALTYVFIAHNLGVVRYVSDRVAVMLRGTVVEKGSTGEVYNNPLHPYTQLLLGSMPSLHKRLLRTRKKEAELPRKDERGTAADTSSACVFFSFCPKSRKECAEKNPVLKEVAPHHWVSCACIE